MDKLIEKVFKPGIQKLVEMFSYLILWVVFAVFGVVMFAIVYKILNPLFNKIILFSCEVWAKAGLAETDSCPVESFNFDIVVILGNIFRGIVEILNSIFLGEDTSGNGVGIFVMLVIIFGLWSLITDDLFPSLKYDTWSVKLKTKVMKSIFKDYKEPEKKD